MLNMRNCITVMLLVLLAAAPMLAAQTSGSGTFGVSTKLLAAGTAINPGEYSVKFKSNSPEVTVTFMSEGKAPILVKGKIVMGDKKFEWDSMLIEKDSSGNDVIKALQFGGKKLSIVFE
jgi:hypothetical protein